MTRNKRVNTCAFKIIVVSSKIMKTFAQYSKEVLTVVMSNLKNGVSGSTIADMMVSKYGFEREAALTIITGTILTINKANLL